MPGNNVGNLGLGVASPTNRIDISGSGNQQIKIVRTDGLGSGGNGFIFKGWFKSFYYLYSWWTTLFSRMDITNNTARLQIVTGITTFTGKIDANGDLDVDGQTDLDNVCIWCYNQLIVLTLLLTMIILDVMLKILEFTHGSYK